MQITLKDLDGMIKSESLSGCFVFFGKEQYLKHHYIEKIRKTVFPEDDVMAFGQVIIQGGDIEALDNEISSLPMFGANKLIEFHDLDFNSISKDNLESFCAVLSNVEDMTVIIDVMPDEMPEIINEKRIPPVHDALRKVAYCVNFERQSSSKLVNWAERHFASYGVSCSRDIIADLISVCGSDMLVLSNEIQKLAFYTKACGLNEVSADMPEKVSTVYHEIGAFDFANAIIAGDRKTALILFSEMIKAKEKPEMIMASLSHITAEILNVKTLSDSGCDLKTICAITGLKEYPAKLRLQAARRSSRESIEKAARKCLEADKKFKGSPLNNNMIIDHFIAEG
ncbi:MAG: DNA polymerase III subunit delta [Clostridia bacterium]|nr:DNA polymerase III subunit delta [Clostridia bacterium]